MARKADPILLRSGINRLWWVNQIRKTSPAQYHYLVERFDKGLASVNAILVELRIFHIKSFNKHIVQAVVFKFFSPRFKNRVAVAKYQTFINQLYYFILWRRWYRLSEVEGSPNLFHLAFYYNFWSNFIKSYEKQKSINQIVFLRNYLQKYFFANTTGFILDPLEKFDSIYEYDLHPEIFLLASKEKKLKPSFTSSRQDVKWSQNLTRLFDVCSNYSHLDFTSVLSRFIARELEKDKRHWPLIQAIRKALKFMEKDTKLKGIKIRFVGKLKGARRSRVYDISAKWPTIPFQSFKNEIFMSSTTAHTVYGSVGIKVMIWRK